MAQQRRSQPELVEPPLRPQHADQPSRLVLLEREVEMELEVAVGADRIAPRE
ncbi:hypothetical protein SBA3_1910002 [Candidatus Sulfopaludibacter sp. SbA3]|nr:hypothetical protein SBA3_1910002 [Candidatus Sulfopaludibacter sp. SbA3]